MMYMYETVTINLHKWKFICSCFYLPSIVSENWCSESLTQDWKSVTPLGIPTKGDAPLGARFKRRKARPPLAPGNPHPSLPQASCHTGSGRGIGEGARKFPTLQRQSQDQQGLHGLIFQSDSGKDRPGARGAHNCQPEKLGRWTMPCPLPPRTLATGMPLGVPSVGYGHFCLSQSQASVRSACPQWGTALSYIARRVPILSQCYAQLCMRSSCTMCWTLNIGRIDEKRITQVATFDRMWLMSQSCGSCSLACIHLWIMSHQLLLKSGCRFKAFHKRSFGILEDEHEVR